MEAEIAKLERDIMNSVNEIARTIELKYRDCIPYFLTITDCQDLIKSALNTGHQNLKNFEKSIEATNAKIASSNDISSKKLTLAKDFVDQLTILNEIEAGFNAIWASSDIQSGSSLLQATQQILRLDNLYQSLNSPNNDKAQFFETITGRILPLISAEINSRKGELRHQLIENYNEFIKIPDLSDTQSPSENIQLVFHIKSLNDLSENFTAMDKLGLFSSRLYEIVDAFWELFVQRIIHSSDPSSIFEYRENELNDRTTIFSIKNKIVKASKTPNVEAIFNSLLELFGRIYHVFGRVHIEGRPFVELFGEQIALSLVSALEKDCLVPSVPSIEMEANIKGLLKVTNDFVDKMKEFKFFESLQFSPFEYFYKNYQKIAVDRHCQELIKQAKELLRKSYIDLIEATPLDHIDKMELAKKKLEKQKIKNVDSVRRTMNFITEEFQFETCKISSSIYEYVGLIREVILSAQDSQSEVESCRYATIIRNILEFFPSVSIETHQQSLTTIPQLAAIFFNNCHYICHCITTIQVDIQESIVDKSKATFPENEFNFTELMKTLKTLASNVLDQQLLHMKRQLTLSLGDGKKLFVGLRNEAAYKNCERSINASVMQIKQVSEVWKAVMMESVLIYSIGVLTSHLLNQLIEMVLANEDIASADSEISANILDLLLKQLYELNTINNISNIQKTCEEPYHKMGEVIFCLRSSLMEIENRWCEGKGPLALWMKPGQVKQLVRALFQNTDRRALLLKKLTSPN